ncbi:MAG TPA: hypothetical protein DCR51_06090, partial [Idiomarina loihiensis]|nr:hypothetical protein [Idiomarina loihiensis]
MENLQREYEELNEEIQAGTTASGEMPVTEFFNLFADAASENGDTPDLSYTPILNESVNGYRVDGYAFEMQEGEDKSVSELYLVVCNYRN